MKQTLRTLALLGIGIGVAGCSNGKSNTYGVSGDSVTDVTPVATTSTPAYTPPPAPQPVVYDSVSTAAPVNTLASSGGSYTIKKGDTLFGIARQRYGDGKQWQKIASANPGLNPNSLRVGQKIVVP